MENEQKHLGSRAGNKSLLGLTSKWHHYLKMAATISAPTFWLEFSTIGKTAESDQLQADWGKSVVTVVAHFNWTVQFKYCCNYQNPTYSSVSFTYIKQQYQSCMQVNCVPVAEVNPVKGLKKEKWVLAGEVEQMGVKLILWGGQIIIRNRRLATMIFWNAKQLGM